MEKYTWDDIIINPNSDETMACIGKEVYFNDSPNACLYYANTGNNAQCGILRETKIDSFCPFVVEKNGSRHWGCIIPKKEEPKPNYVPFSNKEEFLSAYEEHTNSMKKYGIWIFHKMSENDDIIPRLITEMWSNGLIIGCAAVKTLWKYILEDFIFEDGTHCGKEINIKKEDGIIDD